MNNPEQRQLAVAIVGADRGACTMAQWYWTEVLAAIANPVTGTTKEGAGAWVFGTFTDGKRDKAHLVSRSALTTDLDHDVDLAAVDSALDGMGVAYAWHTTYSSTPEAPRLRVIVPLDRDVTETEYARLSHLLWNVLEVAADTSSDQASRIMYKPNTPELADYQWGSGGQNFLAVDDWLPRAPQVQVQAPVLAPRGVPLAAEYVQDRLGRLAQQLAEVAQMPDGQLDADGHGWEWHAANAAFLVAGLTVTPCTETGQVFLQPAEAEAYWDVLVPECIRAAELDAGGTLGDKLALKLRNPQPWPAPLQTGPEAFGLTPPAVTATPMPQAVGQVPSAPAELPGLPQVWDPSALSEVGLARAALDAVGPVARFASDECTWYARTEGGWQRVNMAPMDYARTLLHQLLGAMPHGNADAQGDSPEKKQADRRKMLTDTTKRGRVARLMMDEAPLRGFQVEHADADPYTLWAGGWCWDLRTGLVADVHPLTVHAKTCAVMPAQVPTPRWDALLGAMFPDARDLHLALGMLGAATTGTSGRLLGVVYGATGRGKTTLLELVSRVLGNYAAQLDPDLLDARRSNEFKVYDLKGIRLGWVDEGPSSTHAGQERLKALTGGATLRGAAKGKPSVAFRASHTLFFTDNREPEVSDLAVLDRVRPLEVLGTREGVHQAAGAILHDPDEWLAAEGPGVLWQLMAWARAYLADRTVTDVPEHRKAAMVELAREQNVLASWLDEQTEPGETNATELYAAFRAYAEGTGTARSLIPTMTAWGRALTAMGHAKRKTTGGLIVRPLQVKRDPRFQQFQA